MTTKLEEREYGIREEPADYDDHFDNDNESQQNASALSLKGRVNHVLSNKRFGEEMSFKYVWLSLK